MNTKEEISRPFLTRMIDGIQHTKREIKCRSLMNKIEELAHKFSINFDVQKQWKINNAEAEIFEKWLAFYILFKTYYPYIRKSGFETEKLAIKRFEEGAREATTHQEKVNFAIGIEQDESEPSTVLGALKNTANSVAAIYNRLNQGEIDRREFSRQSALLVRRANVKSKT